MNRDEVFVPRTASQRDITELESPIGLSQMAEAFDDAPLWVLINCLVQQLFGWPAYLFSNASGQLSYPKHTNHFDPEAVIFDQRHYGQIVASDIGLGITLTALYFWAQATSYTNVFMYYGIPYLCVNHWLVLITFLQHTDPMLPHYREGEWTFPRGALATQDRNVYNFFTHSIANSHVAHHISSRIPHYHAPEATEHLKTLLGDHYMFSNEHWTVSLYKTYRACRFVDDDGDVVFFRNSSGKAVRKVVYEGSDSGIDAGL